MVYVIQVLLTAVEQDQDVPYDVKGGFGGGVLLKRIDSRWRPAFD